MCFFYKLKDFQYKVNKHKIDRFIIIGNFKEAITMFQILHLWNSRYNGWKQETTGTIVTNTLCLLFTTTIFSPFHFQITKKSVLVILNHLQF